MTRRALNIDVRAGQGEFGQRMVELCPLPVLGRMATCAGGRYVQFDMIGILAGLIILRMTTVAILGRAREAAVDVALVAGDLGVRSREGELGQGIVIELRARPGCRVVTRRAFGREPGGLVIRVLGGSKIIGMTPNAVGGRSGIPLVYVTIQTIQARVCSRQREAREPRMVEPGSVPRIHPVAGLARGR